MQDMLRPYIDKIANREAVAFSIDKMTGDASNREYFRIRLANGHTPKTMVLMKFQPENAFRSEEASGDIKTDTFPFTDILSYLKTGGMRVPDVYLSEIDSGLVFLEDVGDTLLFSLVAEADKQTRLQWYGRAIELLVDFQSLTLGKPDPNCIAFNRRFDHELLMWEFEHYLEWGVEALFDTRIPDEDRTSFNAHFERICQKLEQRPQVVVHRDFQSRNLMVQNNRLVLIDFQDALVGPLPYDLVALLRDSYVALDDDSVEFLIDRFLDLRERIIGAPSDRDAFRRGFYLQTVQRKLKDAGRFVFIDRVKHNPSFLQWIPNSLAHVRWALGKLDDMQDLAALLGRYDERLMP